ncbi:MAG: alpha-galactosidase, partial [Planctomycetota bacterium]
MVLKMCRDYGFDTVKIDGVAVLSKRGEGNLLRFFEKIHTESKGAISINFDITGGASWRLGHFYGVELTGNLFVENRYALDASYYPYRTLRNLWQLAEYIPTYRLHMEFVNVHIKKSNYPENDPFRPELF